MLPSALCRFLVLTALLGLPFSATAQPPSATPAPQAPPQSETAAQEPASSMTPSGRATLVDALKTVAQDADVETADRLIDRVKSEDVKDADWQGAFEELFKTESFSQPLRQFWDYALRQGAESPRAARISVWCAAAQARKDLAALTGAEPPSDWAPLASALAWMEALAPTLGDAARGNVFDWIQEGLGSAKLDGGALLAPGPARPAALQMCITLASYAGWTPPFRSRLNALLDLPATMGAFWERHGILLFDGGVLDELQLASLGSVVDSFPGSLAPIGVLVQPTAMGLDPAAPGFSSSRAVIYLPPPVSMAQLTNPGLFATRSGGPVAPEFAVAAATEIFRFLQSVEFSRRPSLVLRRDTLIQRAQRREVVFLRRDIPQEAYVVAPDDLLLTTAALWFVNSSAAFQAALDFARLRSYEALESLLLVADVLSGGGGTTLLFTCDPAGLLSSMETPLSRDVIGPMPWDTSPDQPPPPPYEAVDGIQVLGRQWRFPLDGTGAMTGAFGAGEAPPF